MKNKVLAAILAFFFGGIGIHKFYLGEIGMGILYICLTLVGMIICLPIGAILSFVDFILLLVMDDEKFNQKYNTPKTF